jgi:hypothetical protein
LLQAVATNFLAKTFRLHQDDRLVGEVDTSLWRERARLEVEDGTYDLHRERFCAGDFLLEGGGKLIARATKPKWYRCTLEVELPNRHLTLRKVSPWKRRFALFEGENQVGSVYPMGLFSRRTQIDLPNDWPLAIRGFLFWLVILAWKREEVAATA